MGTEIAKYSVLLGACFIEKHFIFDKKNSGVDSEFSIDPKELKNLVEESKKVKTIMGNPTFDLQDSELIAFKAEDLYAANQGYSKRMNYLLK